MLQLCEITPPPPSSSASRQDSVTWGTLARGSLLEMPSEFSTPAVIRLTFSPKSWWHPLNSEGAHPGCQRDLSSCQAIPEVTLETIRWRYRSVAHKENTSRWIVENTLPPRGRKDETVLHRIQEYSCHVRRAEILFLTCSWCFLRKHSRSGRKIKEKN